MAVGMLMAYGYCHRRLAWPSDADARVWRMLSVSGFLGFFVSDLCLFKAFLIIGPRLSLLVTSLTPPVAAVIAWAWRGGTLGPIAWLAMGVTLAGVLWVVLEHREPDEICTSPEAAGLVPQQPPRRPFPAGIEQLRYGLFLASVATVVQAFGMVLAEYGIADYDPAASALIRILGALVGYFLLITVLGRWRPIVGAARRPKPMLILLGGAFVGPFVGVSTCMLALQHARLELLPPSWPRSPL